MLVVWTAEDPLSKLVCALRTLGLYPSSRRRTATWTLPTSSGKCRSLLSQTHLTEKIDEAGPGEILATS
jgi:hypothetical protein